MVTTWLFCSFNVMGPDASLLLAADPMPNRTINSSIRTDDAGKVAAIAEVRRQEALLKAGALQDAIFNSANAMQRDIRKAWRQDFFGI